MRVLVTGGAGFIGGHLVRVLQGAGHRVGVIDAMTYAAREAPMADLFSVTDVRDGDEVRKALQAFRPTHIAHLAAETHVCTSIQYPERFVETNVNGTLALLEACREFGIEKFLHVSTDEVYGDMGLDSWGGWFTENAPLRPSNPYSASKAAGDLLVQSYIRTYGLPAVIARPCNNYGPRQYPEKLIPRSIERARKGLPVEIHGDGRQVREWVHVVDCVYALFLLLRRGVVGEAYNIGTGEERSVGQIAEQIASAYGVPVVHVADRPGGDRRYSVCADKLRALNWSPRIELDDGLASLLGMRAAA